MTSRSGNEPVGEPKGTAYVQTYQSRFSRVLGGAIVAGALACLASIGWAGGEAVLRYGGVVALVGTVGWLAYWRPYLRADDTGVEVRNPFAEVRVPWSELREVEGRYGVRLLTADGRYDVWATPAPTGMQRARSLDSEAAVMLRKRWDRAVALGQATPAAPTGTSSDDVPVGAWERDLPAQVAVAVLAVLAVAGPVLTLL